MGRVFDIIDARFKLSVRHKRFLTRNLPEGLNFFYCLGGLAFTFFLISIFSGLLLSMHYIPSETDAFRSIIRIQDGVMFGRTIRAVHKWSASLLIIFIMLHSIRVFIYKAYRHPRELNWIAGSFTLFIAFGSGFTGYLLPWDQKAYWATEVGTSMAGTIPFIGAILQRCIRGGADINGETLIRFYTVHILWLPLCMAALLWAHFHMVKRNGIKAGL